MMQDRFYFIGFLPAKAGQRVVVLLCLCAVVASLVFFVAPHRITDFALVLVAVFEPERRIVFARELTKLFEEIHRCRLSEAVDWLAADSNRQKGEYTILVEGAPPSAQADELEAERVLAILLAECPLKQAAALAAQITGQKKNALYERALQLKKS